jgi:hypothetical protein
VWHWYEKPNNSNFYYYRLEAPVLAFLPATFAVIAPLAIAGLALAAPRLAFHGSLYLLVLTTIAQMLAFYVISRFRVPLHAALIPFAAFTVVRAATWARERRWLRCATVAAAVAAISFWTLRPLPPGQSLIRPADYSVPFQYYYARVVEEAKARGDRSGADALVARTLRLEPDFVRAIGPGRPPRNRDEALFASLFANAHGIRSETLAGLGRTGEAKEEERRALELDAIARAALGMPPAVRKPAPGS